MSTGTMTSEKPSSGTTTVSVDELIVGRQIEFPIFDRNGVLLLAEGSVITSEVKQRLKARKLEQVEVSNEDLSTITLRGTEVTGDDAALQFDTEMSQRLDEIIESGLPPVVNDGPAVRENIVHLGKKDYDQAQRRKLREAHDRNGRQLGSMMDGALKGEKVDGQEVAAMAGGYLRQMIQDKDNVLSSAINAFQADDLAARTVETALLAMAIGIEMDLDARNVRTLAIAGMVHDWGMMLVPEAIRKAPRRLNRVERLEIMKHPIHTLELLQKVSSLPREVTIAAYQVHERFNGTGYPRGRCGGAIHLFARILQVADAFIGMTSPRPYRPAMMRYAAMECLIRMARLRSVDPDVVRALLRVQSLFPIGSFLTLSDGSVAKVLRSNRERYTQPIVRRIQDPRGRPVPPDADDAIIDLTESDLEVRQALPTPGQDEIAFRDDLL